MLRKQLAKKRNGDTDVRRGRRHRTGAFVLCPLANYGKVEARAIATSKSQLIGVNEQRKLDCVREKKQHTIIDCTLELCCSGLSQVHLFPLHQKCCLDYYAR